MSSSDSDSDSSDSDRSQSQEAPPSPPPAPVKVLTEEELNDLAAKILRAEIMGDDVSQNPFGSFEYITIMKARCQT